MHIENSRGLKNGDVVTFEDGFKVLLNNINGVGDGHEIVLITDLKR